MELFSIRIQRTFQLVSTVDAKGEMNLSAHNGKINLSCKMEELTQYVADSSNYNQ